MRDIGEGVAVHGMACSEVRPALRRGCEGSMLAQAEDGPRAGVQGKERISAKVWPASTLFLLIG